jgi:hypothetical protein
MCSIRLTLHDTGNYSVRCEFTQSTGHTKSTSLDVISSLVTSHVGLNVTVLSDTGSW